MKTSRERLIELGFLSSIIAISIGGNFYTGSKIYLLMSLATIIMSAVIFAFKFKETLSTLIAINVVFCFGTMIMLTDMPSQLKGMALIVYMQVLSLTIGKTLGVLTSEMD